MGTSGGNHGPCLDIGWHVTGPFQGRGTSATRTRRTVPRAGASDRCAGPRTRLLPFGRPSQGQQSRQGPATFDFLGFTCYWARFRKGRWGMYCKTRRASLRRAKEALYDWCRRHRHQPVKTQHAALSQRVRGHFNYFGVSGNFRSLLRLVEATKRAWYKWLGRRSQRTRLTWKRFGDLLQQFPLPRPRITVRIWGG
jgi:hypothetical protein